MFDFAFGSSVKATRAAEVPRYFLDGKECREEIEDKQHKIDHCRQLKCREEAVLLGVQNSSEGWESLGCPLTRMTCWIRRILLRLGVWNGSMGGESACKDVVKKRK